MLSVVRLIVAIGCVLVVVALFVACHQRSVDCGDGDLLTRLFRNPSVEVAEIKGMNDALTQSPQLRDLVALRVSARQVVLLDKRGQSIEENLRFAEDATSTPLMALWQTVYVKHHPGVSPTVPTSLLIVRDKRRGSNGFPMSSHNCTSL